MARRPGARLRAPVHRGATPDGDRDVLVGESAWLGVAPVCSLARQGSSKKTGAIRAEGGAGGTRLAPEQADAARWLALGRGHWPIENHAHGVLDVPCAEERSQGRCGHIPQGMAALRHTVMGLMRRAGSPTIAAACRRFAAQPAFALALIGLEVEN